MVFESNQVRVKVEFRVDSLLGSPPRLFKGSRKWMWLRREPDGSAPKTFFFGEPLPVVAVNETARRCAQSVRGLGLGPAAWDYQCNGIAQPASDYCKRHGGRLGFWTAEGIDTGPCSHEHGTLDAAWNCHEDKEPRTPVFVTEEVA